MIMRLRIIGNGYRDALLCVSTFPPSQLPPVEIPAGWPVATVTTAAAATVAIAASAVVTSATVVTRASGAAVLLRRFNIPFGLFKEYFP
jgi:hypothetical protein